MLGAINGTWAGTHALFHGLPFVVFGAAIIVSRGLPWLGWVGVAAHTAAFLYGTLTFIGIDLPEVVLPVVTIAVSVWMVLTGLMLLRRPNDLTGR